MVKNTNAQKKNKQEINAKDKSKIELAIKSTIEQYITTIKSLTDADEDQSDKLTFINGIYESVINSKGTMVPDDFHTSNSNIEIEEYLRFICDSVISSKKEMEPISFENKGDLKIFQNGNRIIAVGNYFQSWNISKPKIGRKKKPIMIHFLCGQDDRNNWTAKIQDIYKEDGALKMEKIWKEIIIIENTNTNNNEIVNSNQQYLMYCYHRLKQANYLYKKKEYANCYFALKEAKKNSNIPKNQNDEITELTNKLVSDLGEDGNWKQKLFTKLKKEADFLEQKKDYRLAYEFYYLGELVNGKVESATEGMNRCSEKAKKYEQLEALYQDNKLQEAIIGYQNLIETEDDNAVVYASLARCYGALDSINEAKNSFTKAIGLDAKNTNVYRMQAEYYISKKSYAKGIECYNNCLLYCEEASPAAQKTKALIAYTNACLNRTVSQTAIDSCYASLQYYAQDNPEPCILLSDLLKSNFSTALLFADSAINNSVYNKMMLCKAYAQKAKVYTKELRNERDEKKAAQYYSSIKYFYKLALETNRANNEVAFEYGDFLLNDAMDDMKLKNDKEYAKIDSAKYYFDIGSHGYNKDFANKCIWKKAKCNIVIGNFSEAKNQLTEDIIRQLIVKDKAILDLAKIKLYSNQISDAMDLLQNSKSNVESEYLILLCKLKRNQSISNYNEETLITILKSVPLKMIENDFEKLGIDYTTSSNLKSAVKEMK